MLIRLKAVWLRCGWAITSPSQDEPVWPQNRVESSAKHLRWGRLEWRTAVQKQPRQLAKVKKDKKSKKNRSRPISRVLSWAVIHLRRASPPVCSDLPGSRADNTLTLPYLVLLRVGFTLPLLLPAARCALTAPFHPYRHVPIGTKSGGMFSVALAVGSRLPGVTWHSVLWSPDFPLYRNRYSDCLADSSG